MTLSQIAKIAGVAVSTVSKAFSGSGEISEETRNRIFDIAKENNCYGKYIKCFNYKYKIAVILHEFQSGYYTRELSCFSRELKKRNALVLSAEDNFNNEERRNILSYFAFGAKVDGIIMYGTLEDKFDCNTPIITIGKTDLFNSIDMSYDGAFCDAIQHLQENGHTKIAYIGETRTTKSFEWFKNAMNKCQIPVKDDYIILSRDSRFENAGYEAMDRLLKLKDPPTAIIAAYDYIAIGAIKAIKEHGLRVPEDISIIGKGDIKECDYLDIPLTTITSFPEDLCEIVVEELFDKINNQIKNIKKIKVSAQLVKRSSVGRVHKEIDTGVLKKLSDEKIQKTIDK